MWEYKAPGAQCFTAPVKPKARHLFSPVNARELSDIFSARKLFLFFLLLNVVFTKTFVIYSMRV